MYYWICKIKYFATLAGYILLMVKTRKLNVVEIK